MRWNRLVPLLAVAACGGAGCPALVGCSSQLTVRLPAGTTAAQACVAGVCATAITAGGELLVPLGRGAEGETVAVTVTIPGSAVYAGEVGVARTRPSGPRCPPVCVNGVAVVDTAAGRVVGAPA